MNKMYKTYLLNIGVSGIKSIKKEVKLNFYKKTIDKEFNPDKYRIKAIYGENGSGKSALITAMKIFQDLIMNESYLSESKNQEFLKEMVNKVTYEFKFNCEYLLDLETDKHVYFYEVNLGLNNRGNFEIQYEILKVKNGNYPNNNYTILFETKNGELVKVNCGENGQEVIEKKALNLLSTRSFLLVALSIYDKIQDTKIVGEIWHQNVLFLSLPLHLEVYLGEEDQHEGYLLRKQLEKVVLMDKITAEGWKAYYSVNEKTISKKRFKEYQKRVAQLTKFIKVFKPELVSIDIDKKENGDNYECDLNLNYGDYSVSREFESTGIKKLIRLFDCFAAADHQGIVFIDEMDSNLNDVYLCKLLEYFKYYGKGQLCFTTHNLSPMSVLRDNKNSIDFLSGDNHLVSWTARGNATPENSYKNGMIEDSPFNVDATDFVGIFGE